MPEVVGEESEDGKIMVKKIGVLKVFSKDDSKTGNKWSVDCYDINQAPTIDFANKPPLIFEIPSAQIFDAIKYTSMACKQKDCEHIYDSLLIEKHKDFLHMAGCDQTRCAVYKMDKAMLNVDFNDRVLIPSAILHVISKFMDKTDKVSIFYDIGKNRIFFCQKNLEFRVSTTDKDCSKKFPSISGLLDKQYTHLCKINKSILASRLSTASMVNKRCVMFKFNKDNSMVSIKAISDEGLQPSVSIAPANGLSKTVAVVWSVSHFNDVIKLLKDESLSINTPDNLSSFKLVSEIEPNFIYFGMTVKNSKYNLNEIE